MSCLGWWWLVSVYWWVIVVVLYFSNMLFMLVVSNVLYLSDMLPFKGVVFMVWRKSRRMKISFYGCLLTLMRDKLLVKYILYFISLISWKRLIKSSTFMMLFFVILLLSMFFHIFHIEFILNKRLKIYNLNNLFIIHFLIFNTVLLFDMIKIELPFTFGAEMIQILNNPLSNALFVEDMLAGQHYCISHVIIANSTG